MAIEGPPFLTIIMVRKSSMAPYYNGYRGASLTYCDIVYREASMAAYYSGYRDVS
jgi:hypothetical protein